MFYYREFVIQVVQNFSLSLLYGSQYIYQSMPRLLALWLDFGAEVVDCDRCDTGLQGLRMVLQKLNKVWNYSVLYAFKLNEALLTRVMISSLADLAFFKRGPYFVYILAVL